MTDIHTYAHLLPDGEQAGGRVRQVEVGIHLQFGHLVRHVQERFGVHDGGSKGWSYERSMDRGKEGGFGFTLLATLFTHSDWPNISAETGD